MDWTKDFLLRVGLADSAHDLAERSRAAEDGKSGGRSMVSEIKGWIASVKPLALQDAEAVQNLSTVLGQFDEFFARGGKHGDRPSEWMEHGEAALRADARRLARGRSDAELRRVFIELLDQTRRADERYVLHESDIAENFGVETDVVERWVDWADGESLVRIIHGAETIPSGRALKISTDGIDWLEQHPHELSTIRASSPMAVPPEALDVSFIHDVSVRAVLERNIRELVIAQDNRLHTAAIVLAGSVGEGVLYDALVYRKMKAQGAKIAPRKSGVVKDIEKGEWKLYEYIEVAQEIGIVASSTAKMMHSVLRDFRNMIHPKVQVDRGLTPDEAEMKASVAWLEATIRDVRRAPR